MADNKIQIEISARLDNIERDMGKVAGLAENTAGKMQSSFAGVMTGISFAGATKAFDMLISGAKDAAGYIKGIITSTADAQDVMTKMAQKAGMSTESLSSLGYAAQLAGSNTEGLVIASKKLSQNIQEASRSADQGNTIFGNLGISIKNVGGDLRGTDQILLDVATKFAGMENGANKSALAVKLFGKSGLELIPFLNEGRAGLENLTKEAERLGIVVGGPAGKASEQFNDNIERLGLVTEGLKRSIGNAAMPVLNEFVQQLTDAKMAGGGLAGSIKELTTQSNIEEWAEVSAKAVAWVADAAKGVAVIFQSVGTSLGASAAMMTEVLSGNFSQANEIAEKARAQIAGMFNYEQTRDKVDKWFDEYRRTARVNGERVVFETKELAKQAQTAWDTKQAEKKKSNESVVLTESELDRIDKLREKYSAAEKIRIFGEYQYKKEQIEKKYEAELAAIAGAKDASSLEYEIRRRMNDELIALEQGQTKASVEGYKTVIEAAKASADARVTIESGAALQVEKAWTRANAQKAGSKGQGYVDERGNLAFDFWATKSWDDWINEGKPVQGFARGGSFVVGGSGGTDSTPVSFMATPGERVTVETPAQQNNSRGNVTVNVTVNGGNPQSVIAAIKQALRTEPNLLNAGMARAG